MLLKKAKFYWNCIVDESYGAHIQYLMHFLESNYKKCIDCSVLLDYNNYDDIFIMSKLIIHLKEQQETLACTITNSTNKSRLSNAII